MGNAKFEPPHVGCCEIQLPANSRSQPELRNRMGSALAAGAVSAPSRKTSVARFQRSPNKSSFWRARTSWTRGRIQRRPRRACSPASGIAPNRPHRIAASSLADGCFGWRSCFSSAFAPVQPKRMFHRALFPSVSASTPPTSPRTWTSASRFSSSSRCFRSRRQSCC